MTCQLPHLDTTWKNSGALHSYMLQRFIDKASGNRTGLLGRLHKQRGKGPRNIGHTSGRCGPCQAPWHLVPAYDFTTLYSALHLLHTIGDIGSTGCQLSRVASGGETFSEGGIKCDKT